MCLRDVSVGGCSLCVCERGLSCGRGQEVLIVWVWSGDERVGDQVCSAVFAVLLAKRDSLRLWWLPHRPCPRSEAGDTHLFRLCLPGAGTFVSLSPSLTHSLQLVFALGAFVDKYWLMLVGRFVFG